jgi:uncharacterized protein (DUF983 family)
VQDLHRSVKEILDILIFKCPNCQEKRSYDSMIKHLVECGGGGGRMSHARPSHS